MISFYFDVNNFGVCIFNSNILYYGDFNIPPTLITLKSLFQKIFSLFFRNNTNNNVKNIDILINTNTSKEILSLLHNITSKTHLINIDNNNYNNNNITLSLKLSIKTR